MTFKGVKKISTESVGVGKYLKNGCKKSLKPGKNNFSGLVELLWVKINQNGVEFRRKNNDFWRFLGYKKVCENFVE